MTRFQDRVVVVTGAGSGIGRVMAGRFAAEGAKVAVVDWHEDRAREVSAAVPGSSAPAPGRAVRARIRTAARVRLRHCVRGTKRRHRAKCGTAAAGGPAASCAAPATAGSQKSVFLCSKAVLPSMIERGGGVIVNITSVNGLAALGNEAYSAAKAGVINLTQGIAVRYGGHGIRCNAIAPGTIRTPVWQERVGRDPVVFQRLVKWYPLGRVGEPEDIANAAMFLASDEAAWITGTVLRVDGGLLAGSYQMTRELLTEAAGEELGG